MKCTEHDRAHCPEPHCHVLAVCASEIKGSPLHSLKWTLKDWAACYNYPWPTANLRRSRERLAAAMAARLVAWMRWPGALYYDQSRTPRAGCDHPLDAIMSHTDRVAALASKCHDGVNWATVVALLHDMQELGIGLNVVHEWRPGQQADSLDDARDRIASAFALTRTRWT